MRGGMGMISGLVKAGTKAGNNGRMRLGAYQANEQSHHCANMEWRRETLCTKEARIQVIIASLFLD